MNNAAQNSQQLIGPIGIVALDDLQGEGGVKITLDEISQLKTRLIRQEHTTTTDGDICTFINEADTDFTINVLGYMEKTFARNCMYDEMRRQEEHYRGSSMSEEILIGAKGARGLSPLY